MKFYFLVILIASFSIRNIYAEDKVRFDKLEISRVGGSIALVSPKSIDSTIGFGVEAPLGEVYPNVEIGAGLDYWSTSYVGLSFSDFAFGFNGRYLFKDLVKGQPITPYAGFGLDLHFYTFDFDLGLLGKFSETTTELGTSIFAGSYYKFKENMEFFAEARFKTNIDQFNLKLGIIFLR